MKAKTNCTECTWVKLYSHKDREIKDGICSNPKSPYFANIVDKTKSCEKLS
jgi:hypothetical protein